MVVHACNPVYTGGWGRRITWTWEAAVNQDRAIALYLGNKSKTPSQKKGLVTEWPMYKRQPHEKMGKRLCFQLTEVWHIPGNYWFSFLTLFFYKEVKTHFLGELITISVTLILVPIQETNIQGWRQPKLLTSEKSLESLHKALPRLIALDWERDPDLPRFCFS